MSVVENAKEQLLSTGSSSVDPTHSAIEFDGTIVAAVCVD